MSRGALIRFFLVLGLLAGCVALAVNQEPKLGLDLRGGAQFVFQAEGTEETPANAENVDKTRDVLERRVNVLGVSEPTVVRQGEDRILVELPGVTNDEEAAAAEESIGRTAKLTAHEVFRSQPTEPTEAETEKLEDGHRVLLSDQGDYIEIGPAELTGEDVSGADGVLREQRVDYIVALDFTGKGGDIWGDLTAKAACNPSGDPKRRVAIVLDEEVITSPQVNEDVGCEVGIRGGNTDITGDFSQQEAKELAALIEGGSLPLELTLISDRLVGPTLGEKAIDASLQAGVIGIILTGLFIIAVYRLVGAMATIALASYALLAYAMLLALGSTLTLPGLAGFVLAIGMAIDANVLVFERAREEYAAYPSAGLRRALLVGFNKAWTAIIDSNVTTLLAAALLFIFGSGPIKGFGVTLSIGVIASMVSALIIARVLTELAVANKGVARRPALSGVSNIGPVRRWLDRSEPDIMGRRRRWLAISAVAFVLALAGIAQGLNLGVEFTGGRQLDYSVSKDVEIEDAREAVKDAGFPNAVVQEADDPADFTIRTGKISDDEEQQIADGLASIGGDVTKEDDQTIGASLGQELREKALIAFGIALLAQLLYMAVRFKWTFGVAAVVAMFHDVVIVLGIFAWLDKPIDGIFLAAAMTIVGLSINDTVVVFDRVRERWWGSKPEEEFEEVANRAAVETVPRTVNTGLGAMFILAALAVLGGNTLRDFAIALLIGLVVGTYSSIFMATPMLTYLQEKWPMSRVKKERVVRDTEDSGAVV
ncbi:MAG: Protein translocase subunit SecD / Protein translocase subunit SecF [uncultured Nocardioides sp.]|uniref:Multifunctional fusion protein n=1 Tax=uncultured Nocardioides sp. TaxID=198441 RepID=A0A6J4MZZ1_9ACTN|nr:MAG: Protein translocase subunit SecD / Protein translocase subunit SecF [uncultured Nocardioides sp.]